MFISRFLGCDQRCFQGSDRDATDDLVLEESEMECELVGFEVVENEGDFSGGSCPLHLSHRHVPNPVIVGERREVEQGRVAWL